MNHTIIITEAYFDGTRHHGDGPYFIEIVDGIIRAVHPPDCSAVVPSVSLASGDEVVSILRAPFVMPGLVEAHCHLFLDGAELDVRKRKEYLRAPFDTMLATGRRSVAQNLAAGITLIRDAGDLHGVNRRLKFESTVTSGLSPALRSPGCALRKAGRYGSFMAVEVTDARSIVRTVRELATTANDLKILLTGIIDFENGCMKGGLQFSREETELIVSTAHDLGLRTYAHCSGTEGLRVAVAAGIDSIEHGFFMTRDILCAMRDRNIAWVPTFSPVQFQHDRPELSGWNAATVAGLQRILDDHCEHIALADELGVSVVAGSDAGSYGVPHGKGLIDELIFQHRAGMSVEHVLASATSVPRRLWGCEPADIARGCRADLVAPGGSPFASMEHLREVRFLMRGTERCQYHHDEPALAFAPLRYASRRSITSAAV